MNSSFTTMTSFPAAAILSLASGSGDPAQHNYGYTLYATMVAMAMPALWTGSAFVRGFAAATFDFSWHLCGVDSWMRCFFDDMMVFHLVPETTVFISGNISSQDIQGTMKSI
ncbi:Protein of unknown function [Pyronema omphalodes CBS 100304]|uniref:Uncharacterized protein n=1 Tax=Pyronema omphalodes (strain CBS 100304) TaxID=1076935 RepID=U4LDW6_PYROM|nr:Protein of unknown function [Pyronema omphalodes CBS 100304]